MKTDEKRRDSAAASAVPEAGGAVLAAVSSLMEERHRYEGWIAALEARRSATPEHVFARVHADYSTRLNTVIGQLTTHADGLRRELESLTKRLEVLRDERQRAEDARAESELRAHVGELSAEDWTTTSAASDASLADIGERHSAVEQELTRTRELLNSAERPVASVAEPEPESVAAPEPEPAPAPVPEPAPVAAAPAPEPAAVAPAPPVESPTAAAPQNSSGPTTARRSAATAQRNSVGATSDVAEAAMHVPSARASVPAPVVVEPPVAAAEPAAPATPESTEPPKAAQQSLDIVEHVMPLASRATPHQSPNAIPAPRNSSFDELAFLSSVVDTPSGAIEPPPADMPDEKTRRDTFARRSQEDSIVNLTESGSVPLVGDYEREPDSVLSSGQTRAIGRESTGVDGTKTLKCSECSAMNYPTEWYCERCGAELASL